MKKALFLYFFALCFLPVYSFGQTETFVKEYVYGLEEEDSQKSARNNAREQLRKMLLTDILGYVRKNYVSSNSGDLSSSGGGSGGVSIGLYKEAIAAHTQDSMKILDEKYDGYEYHMKASITIDMEQITAYLDRRRNEPESVAETETSQSYNAAAVVSSQPQAQATQPQAGRFGISVQSNLQSIQSNLQNELVNTLPESMQQSTMKQIDAINKSSNNKVVIFLAGTGLAVSSYGSTMAGRGIKYKDGQTIGTGFGIAGGGLLLALAADIVRRVQKKNSEEQGTQTAADIEERRKREPSGRSFVFSTRSEALFGLSAVSVGGTVEVGSIGRNGFYFTTQAGGGAGFYGGAGFNFGGTFNKDSNVKNILGASVGCWYQELGVDMDITRNGQHYYDYHHHENFSIGGAFWKIMFGKRGNFDVTNKLLFGYREACDTDGYWGYGGGYYDYTRFNVTHSLSVGYTFTGGKK